MVAELLTRVRDIRRHGSAALDLCSAAAGRVDAYYELHLNPWDHAAGALVAAEAGLVVTGLPGTPFAEPMAIVAAPSIAEQFVDLLAALHPEWPRSAGGGGLGAGASAAATSSGVGEAANSGPMTRSTSAVARVSG